MKSLVIQVAPGEEGRTLQALLHDRGGFSHATARGLIDAGAVRPLGAGTAPAAGRAAPRDLGDRPERGAPRDRSANRVGAGEYARRVAAGERYEVTYDEGRRYHARPTVRPGRGYRVVHQDHDLLVIDKGAELLTVPTALRDEDSLVERLLEMERERGVRRPALYALHRLDRDTSGLLLFARSRRAFEGLQAQFLSREIERLYTAVATGVMEKDRGTLTSRLVEDPRTLKMRSTRKAAEGKEAVTGYEVSERLPGATVLSVRLLTGRKNQIRVHLAEAGHPLVGDRRYGKGSTLIGRAALHARSLGFIHPVTHRRVSFHSPLPRDLKRLIKSLRSGDGAAARG